MASASASASASADADADADDRAKSIALDMESPRPEMEPKLESPRRSAAGATGSSTVTEGRDTAASQRRNVLTRCRPAFTDYVCRKFGIAAPKSQTPPIDRPNPPPPQPPSLLRQLYSFAYRRRCIYVLGFLSYLALGVGFFCVTQQLSLGAKKGSYFQGSNGTSITDGTYFTAVSLTSIGFGDIYPIRKAAVIFVSVYIYIGVLFFTVVSAILYGVLHMLEDRLISFCVQCWRRSVRGQEVPAAQNEGPRRKTRICIHFVLALLFTSLLAIEGGFYVAVSAVTTVGFGNQSFNKGGDRVYALCLLFPAVLFYGRLGSLIGESLGNPLPTLPI